MCRDSPLLQFSSPPTTRFCNNFALKLIRENDKSGCVTPCKMTKVGA
jgi:hypothetical protein